jgi:hypothetical protein
MCVLYPECGSAKINVMQARTRSFTSGWIYGLAALGGLALAAGCAEGVDPGSGEQLGGDNRFGTDASAGGGGNPGGFPDADLTRPDAGGFDLGDDAAAPPDEPDDPEAEQISITYNSSLDIVPNRFATCLARDGEGGPIIAHRQNSYFRVFNLSDFGITSDFVLESVRFGVAEARGSGGAQPVEIFVGHQATAGAPVDRQGDPNGGSALERLAAGTLSEVGDRENAMLGVNLPQRPVVPAGRHLYVELSLPDGLADDGNHNLFLVGVNEAAEQAPSYFSSETCTAASSIDTFESHGFTNRWIVEVRGSHVP